MKIKAIAFDLDGTLLGTDEKIRPESIKAMLEVKEKGIKIIICTGRPLEDALIPLEGLQKDIFDYAILNNGTYEYDFSNKEIKLNGEINKDILHIFKKIGIKHKALFAIHIPRKAIRGDFFDGE
ncbi:MAG: HAD hydrolase family protein [Mycoplasmataceae bacterium]|nr:HAD hydrolase family protein [Mycoplasmataceae bacterium]